MSETHIELGEEVQSERPSGSVLLAARVPGELADRIQAYAASHGISVSEVLRRGAERITSPTYSGAHGQAITYVAHVYSLDSDQEFTKPATVPAGETR